MWLLLPSWAWWFSKVTLWFSDSRRPTSSVLQFTSTSRCTDKESADKTEVHKAKEVANVRIHVERTIIRIKTIEFLKEHCPLLWCRILMRWKKKLNTKDSTGLEPTTTEPFSQTSQVIELCCKYLSVRCIWLHVPFMSYTRFRMSPHSIVAWMSRNSLLETDAISEEGYSSRYSWKL